MSLPATSRPRRHAGRHTSRRTCALYGAPASTDETSLRVQRAGHVGRSGEHARACPAAVTAAPLLPRTLAPDLRLCSLPLSSSPWADSPSSSSSWRSRPSGWTRARPGWRWAVSQCPAWRAACSSAAGRFRASTSRCFCVPRARSLQAWSVGLTGASECHRLAVDTPAQRRWWLTAARVGQGQSALPLHPQRDQHAAAALPAVGLRSAQDCRAQHALQRRRQRLVLHQHMQRRMCVPSAGMYHACQGRWGGEDSPFCQVYQPVCGADKLSYFSPCFAG